MYTESFQLSYGASYTIRADLHKQEMCQVYFYGFSEHLNNHLNLSSMWTYNVFIRNIHVYICMHIRWRASQLHMNYQEHLVESLYADLEDLQGKGAQEVLA